MATLRGFAKLLDLPLSQILPAYGRKLLFISDSTDQGLWQEEIAYLAANSPKIHFEFVFSHLHN